MLGRGRRRDRGDDEAGRDHVPRREHRLRQRARAVRGAPRDRRHGGHRSGQLAAVQPHPPAGRRGRRSLHPGLPALPVQRRARPAAAADGPRDQRVDGSLHRRHDRGPHRLARRPAGPRARHRLSRRRERGCLQLRLPASRRAARRRCARPRPRSLLRRRPPPRARLRAVRARLGRARARRRSSRPPTRRIGRSTRPSCPASSSSSTAGTRSSAIRSSAPGVGYVGIGR